MNKRKRSRAAVLVFLLFAGYFAYVFIEQQVSLYTKDVRMNDFQTKIQQEQAIQKDLNDQQKMMQSDQYIEKVAREKLGMVKKDEKVFIDTNK